MTPHVSITLLRTQTDARLIELIAAGHDRAFDAVVDRYRRPLLRYARRFLPEEARAEDVVQAAFVSAWGALREGAPVRDLRPWLYRIVHNGALNTMKKPGADDAPLIEASDLRPGPAMEVEQREDVRHALDTIASLPERQRAALLAVALDGRSHADVGEELGINDTAVRQLVSRARASLRVAATAVTPWPAAVWLAGIGGPQATDTATRVGELVGGVGAGTLFGGGALKAGAIVATAGAVAVGVPQVSHVVREKPRPASAQAAERTPAGGAAPAGAQGPATAIVSLPATRPGTSTTTPGASPGGGDGGSGRSGSDDRGGTHGGGEDPGPRGGTPGDPSGDGDPSGEDGQSRPTRREDQTDDRRERRGGSRHHAETETSDDHGGEDAADAPQPAPGPEQPEDRPRPSGSSGTGSGESGSGEPGSGEPGSGSRGEDPPEQPERQDSHDPGDQPEPSAATAP